MARVKTVNGAEAVPAATVSDEVLEKAAEETRRFGLADRIHYWDKKQGAVVEVNGELVRSPEVMLCGNDKSHGALTMHGSGTVLMCCKVHKGAGCTYTQPVSL